MAGDRTLIGLTLAALTACTGVVDEGPARPGAGGGMTGASPGALTCDIAQVDGLPLRRLTNAQYDNTIRDLLGDDSGPARVFAADEDSVGFAVAGAVSPVLAEQLLTVAREVAERAVLSLPSRYGCDSAVMGEDACADAFIADFAPRAFRRPLSGGELDGLRAVYESGRGHGGHPAGLSLVIEAVLASPHFLYFVETDPDGAAAGDVVEVGDFAMATRLSYFLWNTTPDDALLAAADRGELRTRGQIEAAARRLLDDPRARAGVQSFFRQWLHLDRLEQVDKDSARHPEFDPRLRAAMGASTEAFIDEVVFEGDGRLETLLLGSFGYLNAGLAELHGVEGVEGEELVRVELDPDERAGLLTQPSLLSVLAKTNQSDPVHRGLFVRERLLCQQLPPPPNDIAIVAPDPAPGLSTRERFAEHSSNPTCRGCHILIDPVGFGFESYDAVGRYRLEDDGVPVDDTGELIQTDDADGPFVGAVGLAEVLATSPQVRGCVARQVFRYAARRIETDTDACSLAQLDAAFEESDYDLRELLVAITTTDAFMHRRVLDREEP